MTKQASVHDDRLTRALIELANIRQRPRCGDAETHHLWTSEYQAEREQAAGLCAGCPVLQCCADAGQGEKFGVWGGHDRTRKEPAA